MPPPGLRRSSNASTRKARAPSPPDRSQLQNLLTFCRLNKGRVHFVVVFNLTRFARDKYDHFALRSHLQSLGISLRSATEPIDDTSTGKLMEGVLAAFAQFDNDCRSDRTRAGMKAALELGRWAFLAPIGYLNAPRAMGKSLMARPERAPLVRRAFEEYATGRFTKEQAARAGTSLGLDRTVAARPLTSQAIGVLLRNQLYAGIVDVTEYGVRGKRGDFEPLISEELFYRVQAILSGRVPSTAPRQRAHPDFPLRGFVRCESCGRGLTGSWSKGRTVLRFKMPLREGSARAGLQVAFEPYGCRFVSQFDRCHQHPRSIRRGVSRPPRVVSVESCPDVRRQSDGGFRRHVHTPEQVDEPFAGLHVPMLCKWKADAPERSASAMQWKDFGEVQLLPLQRAGTMAGLANRSLRMQASG